MELGSELRGAQGGSIPCLPCVRAGAAAGKWLWGAVPVPLPLFFFFSGCGKPATPAGAEFRWLLSVSGPGSYGKQRSQSCSNLLADELKGCFDPSGYLKIIFFFFLTFLLPVLREGHANSFVLGGSAITASPGEWMSPGAVS